jgi:uncharacterized protein (DUF1501 family)
MSHDGLNTNSPACGANGCREYQQLSRRSFVQASAGVVAFLAAHQWVPRVAYAQAHRGGMRDVIVSIYLRGAADAMSMCVPYFENDYYTKRPTLAIARPDSNDSNRVTALDARFGLPPAMMGLHQAYLDGKMLFVHACGSTDPSRSHFEAQRFMEVGKPRDPSLGTGWLGRHLSSVDAMIPGSVLRGVAINSGMPQQLVGAPNSLPISNLDTFGIQGSTSTLPTRRSALSDMYASTDDPLKATANATLQTISMLDLINFSGYAPANGAVYPTSTLGTQLKSAAALIRAQVGVEAIAVDVGGWDTHENQGPTTGSMANLMSNLANCIGAFYRDVVAGNGPNVTVVVMSEFGRRLQENGSLGTDHGHGTMMMVVGQCVAGGRVLTNWPGLSPANLFEGIDLAVTIDYRDILAEIVTQRAGNTELATVFPDFTPTARGVFSC